VRPLARSGSNPITPAQIVERLQRQVLTLQGRQAGETQQTAG
jgi:hypothetical protein